MAYFFTGVRDFQAHHDFQTFRLFLVLPTALQHSGSSLHLTMFQKYDNGEVHNSIGLIKKASTSSAVD